MLKCGLKYTFSLPLDTLVVAMLRNKSDKSWYVSPVGRITRARLDFGLASLLEQFEVEYQDGTSDYFQANQLYTDLKRVTAELTKRNDNG